MSTLAYMDARRKYSRPQAMVWADSYTIDSGAYVPEGSEGDAFIILSDHSRSEIKVGQNRIENRKRMINGTMRSYHVADKENMAFSWSMLPSRAFESQPAFNASGVMTSGGTIHTADGGAGGLDLFNWYDTHKGPFYVLMSYDGGTPYAGVNVYTRVLQMYFSSFAYDVVQRGITDFWNVSVELEEV